MASHTATKTGEMSSFPPHLNTMTWCSFIIWIILNLKRCSNAPECRKLHRHLYNFPSGRTIRTSDHCWTTKWFSSHPVYHIYFYATQDKTMAIYFMSKCPNKCTQLRQQSNVSHGATERRRGNERKTSVKR